MSRRRRFRPTLYRRNRLGRKLAPVLLILAALAYLVMEIWPDQSRNLRDKAFDFVGYSPAPPMAAADFTCRVAYINDGDTLRCSDGTRVRLHAVAARETDETCSPGHPCPTASAASATQTLKRLASGKTLSCLQTGTSYNRKTAICWTPQGVEINCAMVRSGTTVVWDRFNREEPICRT